MKEIEVWKDVVGYEGIYQISSQGRVKSLSRIIVSNLGPCRLKELIMKPALKKGYWSLYLRKDGVNKWTTIHRLVATAFVENPGNEDTVNHINGIKHDNSIENLEWCSQLENVRHAMKMGLSGHSKLKRLTQEQADTIRELYKTMTGLELAALYNVGASVISQIVRYKIYLTESQQKIKTNDLIRKTNKPYYERRRAEGFYKRSN